MKPKIYIETSISSFYYEDRNDAACVARQEWTQQWWSKAGGCYELLTSVAVIEELENVDYPTKASCLELMSNLPFVAVEPTIIDVVETL